MTSDKTRVLSIIFSSLMIVSMLAVPVVGTGVSTGDAPTASATSDAQADSDVEVSEAIESGSGTMRVFLRFDGERRLPSPTTSSVAAMQERAELYHKQVRQLAEDDPNLEIKYESWLAPGALVEVDVDSAAFKKLKSLDGLERIHENFEVTTPEPGPSKAVAAPNELNTTYGLAQIDAVEAWNEFDTRGENAKVAVLDTGVDVSHPDIELYTENESDPTYPGGWAEFNESGAQLNSTPRDDDQHGTHTSGTVSGGNASGEYVGVAPNVNLMHGMALGNNGGTFAAVVAGMEWAVEEDADVISMSLGSPGGGFEANLIEPVRNARSVGTFVVASAGNEGEGVTGSPGNVYESLSIGASNENRGIVDFSSGQVINTSQAWGDDAPEEWPETYVNPDVSAPGVQVRSTVPGGEYGTLSGTSMAAPHVAGVAALIKSADSSATPSEMETVLTGTAVKPDDAPIAKDVRYGTGIVDADAAVAASVSDSGIEGTVTSDGQPVAGAVVELQDGPRVQTDENGTFSVPAAPGERQLTVSGFGFKETTTTVTVEENQTTTVDIAVEPALDVELVEPQTDAVQAGNAANLTVNVANVEELTIELTGNYSAENATLLVAGQEVEFGQTLTFDRLTGEVPVTVKTAPNTSGSFSLQHTFAGLGEELTVTTGPTNVFEELIHVGVVDDSKESETTATIETLDATLSGQYVVEYVSARNATDVVGEFDSFVVQNFGDAETAGEFVDTTDSFGVGVVLLDQWGSTSDAIPQVSEATGVPADTFEDDLGTEPVRYQPEAQHPILEGVGAPGENVTIHTGTFADHAWFEDPADATVLAEVGDQDGIAGDALAVDEETNTVYAASLGRSNFVDDGDFTAEADAILGNAVEHVSDTTGPEPQGEMTIEDVGVPKDGETDVTVSTTATGVAGYQANISFDPSVVQVTSVEGANFRDPVVNIDNEAGYVSFAQSQANAVDEPALAEITVEAVGDGGTETELRFDRERSLVNDREGKTIPTTFESGDVTIQSCVTGDVNEDGQVTSGDATLVLRHIVGEEIDGTFNEVCGDVNGDGEITSADATGILQRIVGSA